MNAVIIMRRLIIIRNRAFQISTVCVPRDFSSDTGGRTLTPFKNNTSPYRTVRYPPRTPSFEKTICQTWRQRALKVPAELRR